MLRFVRGDVCTCSHLRNECKKRRGREEGEGGGAGKDSHDGAISVSVSLSAMVTSQYRFQNNTLYVLF